MEARRPSSSSSPCPSLSSSRRSRPGRVGLEIWGLDIICNFCFRLVRELEKKFSGKHVVFIAQRRILPKPTRKANKLKQKRPRSRTLQAVHNSILDDLVYPAEIVGKRIRIRLDGSRLFKVHLDKTQQTNIEHKTDTFANVYKKLTGKEVTFEFPEAYL